MDGLVLRQRVLACEEEEFDKLVGSMGIQDVVDTISTLQSEMDREQKTFDQLSKALQNIDEEDPRHDEVSAQLVESQTRLAMLASRNMKCFSQQIANDNQDLLTELADEDAEPGVFSKKGEGEEDVAEKSDPVKTGPSPPPPDIPAPVLDTVFENDSSQASRVSPPASAGSSHKPPPREGLFRMRSSFDRDEEEQAPRRVSHRAPPSPQVTSPTSFTVRSSHPSHPGAHGANNHNNHDEQQPGGGQDEEKAERINFASARSMFEGGQKKQSPNFKLQKASSPPARYAPTSPAPVPAPVPAPAAAQPTKITAPQQHQPQHQQARQNDIANSSSTSGSKLSTATVVLSGSSQHNGQTGSPRGPSDRAHTTHGGISQKSNRLQLAHSPGGSSNGDEESTGTAPKARVAQPKTWLQTVREMGNQSCTRTPKQEPETPTNDQQSEGEAAQPQRGLYTPPPLRDTPSPTRGVVQEASPQHSQHSQHTQPEYNIAPVRRGEGLPAQEAAAKAETNTLRSTRSSERSLSPDADVRSHSGTIKSIQSAHSIHSTQSAHSVHSTQSAHSIHSTHSVQSSTASSQKANNHVSREDVHVPSAAASQQSLAGPARANGLPGSHSGQSVLSRPVGYQVNEEDGFNTEDKVKDRVTLRNWDPIKMLQDVYAVKLQPNTSELSKYINMEGYMEKLPQNKTKATLLKTWKRRYFKAKDGVLYYYESKSSVSEEDITKEEEINFHNAGLDHATGHFQLMGGTVEDLGNKMLGIDDGRGRYLITRCPTDSEFLKWKRSLDTQTVGNIKETYVQPVLRSPKHSKKSIVVIDLGSCSVRAGILGEQASLPQVFFPTVVATDKDTGVHSLGFDAFKPEIRSKCTISYPIRPTVNVDKFSMNMDLMPVIFGKVFKDLKVDPKQYLVMLSSPASLNDGMKGHIMEILVGRFGVRGVNIVNQTLLSLYSYSAASGIVVDIGERLEIVPITDGYIVEGGVTRQPYGGHKIADCLNATLAESKYHFFSHVDFTIVRRVMEEVCYVSQRYDKDLQKCEANAASVRQVVNLDKYDIPDGFLRDVCSDVGRFRAPEGLFNLSVWGMDNPPLHKLVQKAVQACPMDTRREMWRNIYLSGGVTQLPGFTERLQAELIKIVPGSIVVQVHSSPQRYHAAYIGACTLAGIAEFERSCITSDEWKQRGLASLQKWQLY